MEAKNLARHEESRAPGRTRGLLAEKIAHHQSKQPSGSNVTTAQPNTAIDAIDALIESIDELDYPYPNTSERKRFSWLSLSAAKEFATDSHTLSLRPPPPADQIEQFFAGLQWTTRATWSSDRYEITPTSELLVHPSIRSGGDFGVVLRGRGWRCTRNGGCGHEDLAGQVMRRGSVEIVDLAATVAKLTAGAA